MDRIVVGVRWQATSKKWGKRVCRCRQILRRRQIERHDADLFGVDRAAQPLPVWRGEARQPIDLLDQQYVTGFAVG